jgi:BMFP domain-containing protein YqiC
MSDDKYGCEAKDEADHRGPLYHLDRGWICEGHLKVEDFRLQREVWWKEVNSHADSRRRITELEAALAKVTAENAALKSEIDLISRGAANQIQERTDQYNAVIAERDTLRARCEELEAAIDCSTHEGAKHAAEAMTQMGKRVSELEATLQSYRDTRAVSVNGGGK